MHLNNNAAVVVCLATMMMSLDTTDAYPGGPPVSTANLCTDMTPQHGPSAQTSTPPYTITTTATCYTPGQDVTGKTFDYMYVLDCVVIKQAYRYFRKENHGTFRIF